MKDTNPIGWENHRKPNGKLINPVIYEMSIRDFTGNDNSGVSENNKGKFFLCLADNERFDTQVKLMLLVSQIDNRIEPHPISKQDVHSNNPFAAEIIKTGIELKLK